MILAGEECGEGARGAGGDGGPAGDLVVRLAVEHGQVERLEQVLLAPVRQVGRHVVQQGRVAAVVVSMLGQGGEPGADLVAFGSLPTKLSVAARPCQAVRVQ